MSQIRVHISITCLFTIIGTVFLSCNSDVNSEENIHAQKNENSGSFNQISSKESNVHFINTSAEPSPSMNCFEFFNIYNGGGVAIGDINNDGLQDIYFTGNQVANKLYLNQGNFTFKDITKTAGVSGSEHWTTGVTMIDINADGFLDIYICMSGNKHSKSNERENLLYINNKDLTFTESASTFGINDASFSNHAAFLDYDKDGDLDMYLLNHPSTFTDPIQVRLKKSQNPGQYESDKLYRNNGDFTFTDVTKELGMQNYGFGLSVSVGDINNDGWSDIFVANDYSEPDHVYLNDGQGRFNDIVHEAMPHISQFSMGSDISDFNNDGLQDILVLDMMAESNRRKKTNMSSMQPEAFYKNVQLGRHFQYMQNVLHMNNGNNTFSDIAEMAGVSNTDWSWAPLICDLDNDGLKDIFISNGMRKDIRNNDFAKKLKRYSLKKLKENLNDITAQIPSERLANFSYKNKGDLSFQKNSSDWGLNFKGFSNGAAYADLDNDGDLDLVVNNLDDKALIYENNVQKESNYLQVHLTSNTQNTFAIGAEIQLTTLNGEKQYWQLNANHGFLSSSSPMAHFGLGKDNSIKKLEVIWPDGKETVLTNLTGNQRLLIDHSSASSIQRQEVEKKSLFTNITDKSGLKHIHQESGYFDYNNEILLPHLYSRNGPYISVADVDGNGQEDFYISGAAGHTGALYLQNSNGKYTSSSKSTWNLDKQYEDMQSHFFDADSDGDMDLYVVSGSNEWPEGSTMYQDRLYLNDGKGNFTKSNALPEIRTSGSRVISADIDLDGDLDLFIGGRLTPQKYPTPANSLILVNEDGQFSDKTVVLAPEFNQLGMVTDAVFTDLNGDQLPDLVLSGEWMPISFFYQENGVFINKTEQSGLQDYTGWWYSLNAADFDNDGDMDFIAGNLGLNSKYKVKDGPLKVFGGDIDKNGKNDIVLAYHENGSCYPVRGKQCSSQQMPGLNKKFKSYEEFALASVEDIYDNLTENIEFQAKCLYSGYIENMGEGNFRFHPLPNDCQISPMMKSLTMDINGDGHLDFIYAGNLFSAEVETCRHDASIGGIFLGNGQGEFSHQSFDKTGFYAHGDVKDIMFISGSENKTAILIARNNDKLDILELN